MTRRCHRCGAELAGRERVGRRDACLRCGSDLHCCLNCRFYDPACHNQCREPQAERQVDKDRGNFCEYFDAGGGAGERSAGSETEARARLNALFRARGES